MTEPKAIPEAAYPYLFKQDGKVRVLLWVDGGRERDYFLKGSTGQLLIADSIEQLRARITDIAGTRIFWDECGEVDLDQFWKKLRGLRSGRTSSQATCSMILAGWNFLEDLAHSIAPGDDLTFLDGEQIQRAYEKIFGGCNLPPVTPEGHQYQPIWLAEELAALKSGMKLLWQCIANVAPNLVG